MSSSHKLMEHSRNNNNKKQRLSFCLLKMENLASFVTNVENSEKILHPQESFKTSAKKKNWLKTNIASK